MFRLKIGVIKQILKDCKMLFLELEAPYIAMSIFILFVIAVITTRKFSPKNSFKIFFPLAFIIFSIAIFANYKMVTKRMYEVEKLFLNDEAIICENRTNKLFLKNVLVQMKDGWSLRDHIFENPEYFKSFHSARCFEFIENIEESSIK